MTMANQFPELGVANVPARDSGLPGEIVVFASKIGPGPSDPRIQVSNIRGRLAYGVDTFSVSVSDAPAVLDGAGTPWCFSKAELHAISSWVILNKQVLLNYWGSDDYSTRDFLKDLTAL